MRNKYEFLLHTWGGFYNKEYRDIHGQQPGFFWFKTAAKRLEYINKLRVMEKEWSATMLALDLKEGRDTRRRTIAEMVFVYDGREYPHTETFAYAYPLDSARFMFFEGNYSCDCNRSLFINRGLPDFPELPCGDRIGIKDFKVRQGDKFIGHFRLEE